MTTGLIRKLAEPLSVMILVLTIISYLNISERTILPDVPKRMEIQSSILNGTMEPPYQYRVMKPLLGKILQSVILPLSGDDEFTHALSYQILNFAVFLGIYVLLYRYLRNFFSVNVCILGMALFAALLPLCITSIWEEGDYITLLLYLAGLSLIFSGKEKFFPLIILAGVFNRDQIIFLLMFYAAFLYSEGRLNDRAARRTALLSVLLWTAGYLSLRLIFGFRESVYTVQHNVSTNINTWRSAAELWAAMILVFAVLSISAFRRSGRFFKFGLFMLIPYTAIYFCLAIVTQLAKFLPAYLILIPMSLQALSGEYTSKNDAEEEPESADTAEGGMP